MSSAHPEIFVITFLVAAWLAYYLWRHPMSILLDSAGDRSLHQGVIPRSGGVAIVTALLVGVVWQTFVESLPFAPAEMAALLLVAVVSLWDDWKPVGFFVRLAIHSAAAVLVVCAGLYYRFDATLPLTVIVLVNIAGMVWFINLYNFMDGMDGFAALMTMTGLATYALLGYWDGDYTYARTTGLIVVAVAGFAIWNLPPARIFMGDLGSTVLGTLVVLQTWRGLAHGLFPLWVPVLVFSPFWLDATYTLVKRILRREAFWQAHRSHFYQRLVARCGFRHTPVLLGEFLLMLACSLSVILPLSVGLDYNYTPPMVWAGVYTLLLVALERWLATD